MTNSAYEKIIERYFEEVWNQGDLDVLDEIIAPDYINHSSSIPDPAPGPTDLKPIVAAMRLAFPDLHYEVHDLVIGDGKMAVRCTMTGTHQGDFFGIPPTGQSVRVSQLQIEYIRNGQIVEHWRQTDELVPNQSNSCSVSKKINRENAKNAKIFIFSLAALASWRFKSNSSSILS